MFVTKDQYDFFEKEIGKKFYHSKVLKTNKIPTDGNPAILKTQKVTLNLDLINKKGRSCSQLFDENKLSQLPDISYINLYHMGNDKIEGVKFGYDKNKKKFIFPGCDFGGLTNYRMNLGDVNKLSKTGIMISKDSSVQKVLNMVYTQWKKVSKKPRFYGKLKLKLRLYLLSVIEYLNSQSLYQSAVIRFFKLPSTRRIVYTSKDISKSMGRYYIREYGKGDAKYARNISPNKNIYCSVWKPEQDLIKITPNVNKNNLLNEFTVY